MEKQKLIRTMQVFDEYERRFAEARLKRKFNINKTDDEKEEVREKVKEILAYDEKLLPEIRDMREVSRMEFSGYSVTQLTFSTWEGVHSAASLYIPDAEGPLPLVFLFCGHGKVGRLSPSYAFMAHRLVKLGFAVIVPDNIGQGDREFMGHWDSVGPFWCGLTLQGMIVMESVALIRHMRSDKRFDKGRFVACGNSGGGTLCLLLTALAPELAAISASGYPSEFEYIFSKERKHCSCNLLPGIMKGPEMWEILSLFAPKPLLLEQGELDHLIPNEYAQRNARKVRAVYELADANDNFDFKTTGEAHAWKSADRYIISSFLAKAVGMPMPTEENDESDEILASLDASHVTLPSGALTTDAAAEMLTGIKMPEGTRLSDIFPPKYNTRPLTESEIVPDLGRGDVMKFLAQMECALEK